jgi:hypothetical protein
MDRIRVLFDHVRGGASATFYGNAVPHQLPNSSMAAGRGGSRRIVINDDGDTMAGMMTHELSEELIREKMIDSYSGSPVDAFSFCIGNSEVFHYATNIGERDAIGPGLTPHTPPEKCPLRMVSVGLDSIVALHHRSST